MTTANRPHRALPALILLMLAASDPTPARAQDLEVPRGRQGYYLAIGGQGTTVMGFEDGRSDALTGGAASLRLGQMLTSRLGLGIRLEAGSASGDGVDGTLGAFALEGQLRLWRDLALHAGVGLGYLGLTRPARFPGMKERTGGGYGAVYALDASHDWFLTGRRSGGWSLAPTLGVRYLPGDGARALSLLVGGQLSWWSGRPRHQLILPETDAYQ